MAARISRRDVTHAIATGRDGRSIEVMQPDTIIITSFITVLAGGLGTLVWGRLNRMEENMVTRHDFDQIRNGMTQIRDELAGFQQEFAVMRSDLTHVALAVGADRPKASEG